VGDFMLQSVLNGVPGIIAYCSNPCAIVRYNTGQTIEFSQQSVIGAAFNDAFAGQMAPIAIRARVSNWVGLFRGKFEGGADGYVKVSSKTGKRLFVSLSVASQTCVGEFKAPVYEPPTGILNIYKSTEGGQSCHLTLTRSDNRIDVTEDGCLWFHGAECSFNGSAWRPD